MGRALLVIIPLVLAIYALIDCVQTEPESVRGMRKPLWLLAILVPVVGALGWLIAGRPRRRRRPSAPPRVVAPDDNPDFLRQMRSLDEEHEQLLRQWERDLKRRERDLGPTTPGKPRPSGPRPSAPRPPRPSGLPGATSSDGRSGPAPGPGKGSDDRKPGGQPPRNSPGPTTLTEPAAEPPGDEPQSA